MSFAFENVETGGQSLERRSVVANLHTVHGVNRIGCLFGSVVCNYLVNACYAAVAYIEFDGICCEW